MIQLVPSRAESDIYYRAAIEHAAGEIDTDADTDSDPEPGFRPSNRRRTSAVLRGAQVPTTALDGPNKRLQATAATAGSNRGRGA